MEIQTFAQIHLKFQDACKEYDAHKKAYAEHSATTRDRMTYKTLGERHKRKIKHYLAKLDKFGLGTIIEITGKISTYRTKMMGDQITVNTYKPFSLLLSNITMDDARTLVKYKYKNIDLETISIKEIHCGVLNI